MLLSYSSLADELLKSLEDFDAKIAPQGLYAAEEHVPESTHQKWRLEWDQCLTPCLQALGAVCIANGRFGYNWRMNKRPGTAMAGFGLPQKEHITLDMIKISKIKVRVYGDSHRIDPHLDFSKRWEEYQLASHLKRYQPDKTHQNMLLLVGFDGHKDPLRKELLQLREDRNWEHFGWTLSTRSWPDPHRRGFNTLAALWIPTLTDNDQP
ncbi:hypothetical protein [Brevifollis gellanilyticus]|uniref:Uncharacterized protein n=1 Tax=Brevifollis gellanilyticus TaxID=748831 RepID=A0A512M9N7_9BACT|nr:hypothetical protein [Brevifollis gellanilyticus]GEP43457.1 hypothetical protein BGE01nite_27480 [Brevifollis gellanilyticus]